MATTDEKRRIGQKVYNTICNMFDDKGFHYKRFDDDLAINCSVRGEDIPIEIIFMVSVDRQLVQLHSPMPFTVPEDKRVDIALAITTVNYRLINGSFDFDFANGKISFRLAASYIESILGKELFEYMLMASASTVDEYNDKFMMMAKGMMTFEQFLESNSEK